MEDNRLGNYRNDISNLPEESGDPEKSENNQGFSNDDNQAYHQEINTLKIEKLAQRITIISVILPCIIIALLTFAYIDMKERVVDVDETQGSHTEQIAKNLEEKLNALDVRIAKTTFDLDEKLVLIEKKSQALENQAAKMSSTKADLTSMNTAMAKLEKQIKTNSGQDKSTLVKIQGINRQFQAAIKESNAQFESRAGRIKDEIQLFKEEFDARLLELSAYEQQIAQLTKNSSLQEKQIKTLKQETELAVDRKIDQKLTQQRKSLEKMIKALETQMNSRARAQKSTIATPAAPESTKSPKTTPSEPSNSNTGKTATGISEQTLTQ